MKINDNFGLYAVLTNPRYGYEHMTGLLVEHHIPFVQLRIKDAPESAVETTARAMKKITQGTSTKLIINDYPHIAAEIGADGVHIGQDDLSFKKTRKIVGPDALIGISTHSPEQTRNACALKPDYIGIGPVYATPTKKNPDPVIGIDGMKAMLEIATVPAVVIGGIDLTNLSEVLKSGARNFCMVRQLMNAEKPGEVLGIIRELLISNSPGKSI
ncbi:MAG: thiamine phosphate synthase [Chitinivibrionales bacterium]|nr:thiamine phosphate synthase [Chitinivibrionales bacterium]